MSILRTFFRHPLVMLATGATAGYFICKYRTELMAALAKGTDMSRDFLQQRKENLEDILEEAREAEEEAAQGEGVKSTESPS
jgi:proteasome assembly chaperone (PAC2) family protein